MGKDPLLKLERNDEDGAIAVARDLIQEDALTNESLKVLLNLQDDSESLERRLIALQDALGYTPKE